MRGHLSAGEGSASGALPARGLERVADGWWAVVTFLWSQPNYTSYTPEHVNVLRRSVARYCAHPHKFFCVTDVKGGFDPDVVVVDPWDRRFDHVRNPCKVDGMPSCYRRLCLWGKDAGRRLGDPARIIGLDIDAVVTGDLTPLWNRKADVVLWTDPLFPQRLYNGSMILLRPGARPDVLDTFDPDVSPAMTRAAGLFGSDQAWISHCIGSTATVWSREDGVYSFRLMEARRYDHTVYRTMPPWQGLPANARIVMFHGNLKPWDAAVQQHHPWVRAAWV